VITLVVTSQSSGAGKTAVCAGIASRLQNQGKKVGYLRPVIGAPPTGGDAYFMKDILSLEEPLESLCPAFTNESMFDRDMKAAFDAVAVGKDVMIVESASASIAKSLEARILNISTYTEYTTRNNQLPVSVTGGFESINGDALINKVPLSRMEAVRAAVKLNSPFVSVIHEDRALMTFTIAELARAIDGEILNDADKTDLLAENFMLGAMTIDSGVPYFHLMNNKVAIVRADRPDMQSAALQTSTRAIIVAGTAELEPLVQGRAQSKQIPFIRTRLDCAAVAGRIEDTLVKTRFHQKSKLPRLMEILQHGFDDIALHHVMGM